MNRTVFSSEGLVTSTIIALAMIGVALFFFSPALPLSDFGICIPSPSLWKFPIPLSIGLNIFLLIGVIILLISINRRYILVQGGGMMLEMAFISLVAANPFISASFNASTLLLLVNVISMSVLFGTFRKLNATQDFFFIATLLSVGSMMQYAFVPMIPAYIIGGFFLGSLRFKEFLAFGMGLIAPYWVALGLGIIDIADFRTPTLLSIFTNENARLDILIMMIATGLTLLLATFMSLNNAVRLFAGNSRIRKCNNVLNILGYLCALCMLIDFNNFFAYQGTFYLWCAVQTGNFLYFNRLRHPRLAAWIMLSVLCTQWALIIFY